MNRGEEVIKKGVIALPPSFFFFFLGNGSRKWRFNAHRTSEGSAECLEAQQQFIQDFFSKLFNLLKKRLAKARRKEGEGDEGKKKKKKKNEPNYSVNKDSSFVLTIGQRIGPPPGRDAQNVKKKTKQKPKAKTRPKRTISKVLK
jgi:hypothetical protein